MKTNNDLKLTAMITKNDIESIGNEVIYYIDDNNICYQFEPWDSFNEEQIDDAKAQLALILSISKRDIDSIENHMRINGYDGHADVYEAK